MRVKRAKTDVTAMDRICMELKNLFCSQHDHPEVAICHRCSLACDACDDRLYNTGQCPDKAL